MSRSTVLRWGTILVLASGILTAGAETSKSNPAPGDEIAKLRRMLADEVERNQMLQDKVRRLEQQLKDLEARRPAVATRPDVRSAPRVRDNWVPQQFNGFTYYLVPLAQEQAAAGHSLNLTTTVPPRAPAR